MCRRVLIQTDSQQHGPKDSARLAFHHGIDGQKVQTPGVGSAEAKLRFKAGNHLLAILGSIKRWFVGQLIETTKEVVFQHLVGVQLLKQLAYGGKLMIKQRKE